MWKLFNILIAPQETAEFQNSRQLSEHEESKTERNIEKHQITEEDAKKACITNRAFDLIK